MKNNHGVSKTKISLRALLIMCALFLVVLTILVSGLTSIFLSYKTAEDQAANELMDKARMSAASVVRRAEALKNELMVESTNKEIQNDSLSVEERFNILKSGSDKSHFLEFSVANADGITYNSDGKIDISDQEYFQKAMSGITYISNPLIQRRGGSLVLMSATRFEDHSGVAFGVIPYDAFSTSAKDIQIGDTGFVYLLDKSGDVILYPDMKVIEAIGTFADYANVEGLSAEEIDYYTALGKLTDTILAEGEGFSEFTANGITNLVAYMPILSDEGWTVVSIVPKAEMFEAFHAQLRVTLLALVLMLVVGVLLSLWFSRIFTRPIAAISNRLRQISAGDLHTKSEMIVNTKDFQDLSDLFDSTTAYLNDYVNDIDYVLGYISKGDLNVRSQVDYVGDFVGIGESLNEIQTGLNNIIATIVDATEHIEAQSEQISDNAQSLADGSVSGAASLKHLTDITTHVNHSIESTLSDTIVAGELSGIAKETASVGTAKVEHLLNSIDDIDAAASSIGRINKVIEEIAFQTNILALNAAVEAARAGQQGRGFAVVADEVRSLAARSAQASKETSELISQVLAAISEGSLSAKVASDTFHAIHESVYKVDEIMSSISQVSAVQAKQISNLNKDIDHIAHVTETSSSASIELAATSKEFKDQAGLLSHLVAGFKLSSKTR